MAVSKEQMLARASQLPEHCLWELFIDGNREGRHPLLFDKGKGAEPGYILSMTSAYKTMLAHIDAPLSTDIFKQLHHDATRSVHGVMGNPGHFKKPLQDNTFGLGTGWNLSREGLNEFIHSDLADECSIGLGQGFRGWSREYIEVDRAKNVVRIHALSSSQQDVTFPLDDETTPDKLYDFIAEQQAAQEPIAFHPPPANEKKVAAIFERYHNKIASAENDEEKLDAIIEMVSELEKRHLFRDGNIRTCVLLTLNRELIQNGFTPVILDDPNRFDMHSRAELKSDIKKGMARYAKLAADPPKEASYATLTADPPKEEASAPKPEAAEKPKATKEALSLLRAVAAIQAADMKANLSSPDPHLASLLRHLKANPRDASIDMKALRGLLYKTEADLYASNRSTPELDKHLNDVREVLKEQGGLDTWQQSEIRSYAKKGVIPQAMVSKQATHGSLPQPPDRLDEKCSLM